MGLDNMGDIHIPDGFLDPGYRGLGERPAAGMSEEDMLAAAIQASLADMNINENSAAAAETGPNK